MSDKGFFFLEKLTPVILGSCKYFVKSFHLVKFLRVRL